MPFRNGVFFKVWQNATDLHQGTSAAKLGNGTFVETWTNIKYLGSTMVTSVHVSIFDPDSTSPVLVPDFAIKTTGSQGSSSVAALADNQFVVTWNDSSLAGDGTTLQSIRGQVFTQTGAKTGVEFQVNAPTAGSLEASSVTTLATGAFVVTWIDRAPLINGYAAEVVHGQIFTDAGVKLGGEFALDVPPQHTQLFCHTAALANGGFVMSWTEWDFLNSAHIYTQLYQADGTKLGLALDIGEASVQHDSSITALAGGGFVMTWNEFGPWTRPDGQTMPTAPYKVVRGQAFDDGGNPVGSEFLVNTSVAGDKFTSSVAGLSDGRFVVNWIDVAADGAFPDCWIKAQVFAADGSKSGDEFMASNSNSNANFDTVTALDGGKFVVSWSGYVTEPVAFRVFDATVHYGKPTAETVIGGTLDDTFFGNAGNDILLGMTGNDRLSGGTGDDTLDGGDGCDTADYSTALQGVSAILTGGSATGADAGTDTLIAIENVIGGAAGDHINGDTNDNVLTGNGGDDLLFGFAGVDTLVGGDGNDTLVGNAGGEDLFAHNSDTLDGGAGNDTFYAETNDTVIGGAGTDFLYSVNAYSWTIDLGATSIEWMLAGFGDDYIHGTTQTVGIEVDTNGGNDFIAGSNLDDRLWAGVGDDIVMGAGGDDMLFGDQGADSLFGGDGNDRIYIDSSDTLIDGGAGYDAVYIATGIGVVLDLDLSQVEWVADYAGGDDTLDGATLYVEMTAYAGGGRDIITGGSGNDFLWGGSGDDTISGGYGNDVLVGGTGADHLTGGAGIDVVYLNSGGGSDSAIDIVVIDRSEWGTDFVFDFTPGEDKIDLSALGTSFAALSIANSFGHAYITIGGNPDLIAVANSGGVLTETDFLF